MDEWAGIEYELLRERGLWGPPIGSFLDKFQLDMTEGPCRMRKKMVRNDMFYIHYPYVPDPEPNASTQVSLPCFPKTIQHLLNDLGHQNLIERALQVCRIALF